ncbi:MAG: UDP-3-O-(3-hydroxymyristoyl)glucosamine N-acyltransferase [Prolixibacteraceae bacterium]|nr:UDP-3-O-(3-hydroxymyristoyl)glucosamine N-acyltransferase [Prolixibacteraceae bacterium]MBN2648183.1 UDP-3-O-(3-hydroxymyristoyl)glucosamine N-acyltransferase [Prolixibacteraceae bacterium]
MEFTVREIAAFLKGEVVGNQDITINNVSKIEEGKPGTLTFLANPKYNAFIYETKADVVLVNRSFKPEKPVAATLIKVQNAYEALASLMDLYVQSLPKKKGIEIPSYISANSKHDEEVYIGAFAYIDEGVVLGKNVQIYPHVWIGRGSVIGDNTVIFAGAKIYPETKIGKNCIIHAGAVIGSDGFGFAPQENGEYKKLQQIGNVIVEDNVEIGANTTIDCATMGATIVRHGVKIDNLVQVAHNVEIKENTVIAAQTGIAGSSTVGSGCVLGGQVGVAGHIKIGNNVTFGAKTGVKNNVKDNSVMMGEWAMDARNFRRVYAVYKNLPELYHDFYTLKRNIDSRS